MWLDRGVKLVEFAFLSDFVLSIDGTDIEPCHTSECFLVIFAASGYVAMKQNEYSRHSLFKQVSAALDSGRPSPFDGYLFRSQKRLSYVQLYLEIALVMMASNSAHPDYVD